MKKFTKTIILTFIFIALSIIAAACSCNKTEEDSPTQKKQYLQISNKNINICVSDELYLDIEYSFVEGATLRFYSSNEEVATVSDEGKITALKCGTSTITVKYSDMSETASVTVGLGETIPQLILSNVADDSVQIMITDEFSLSPKIYYGGKFFVPDSIEIEINESGENVVGLEGYVIKPVSLGTATVVVKAQWMGADVPQLTKTFTLNVVNNVSILINDGSAKYQLYNFSDLGGNHYETELEFKVFATECGKPISNVKVEVKEGNDIITYSDEKISAKGNTGSALIEIIVKDSFNCEYVQQVEVEVLPSIGNYAKVIDFSAFHGVLPLNDIFGENVDIVSAKAGDRALKIGEDKKTIFGLTSGKDGAYSQNITVFSSNQGWNLSLNVYSSIIREASDLEIFHVKKAWNDKFTKSEIFDGYYLLGNDIDCAGYIYGGVDANGVQNQNVTSAWSSSNQFQGYGLTGTFDGNGHTIKNLTTSGAGLFFAISGGTVKDLNLRGNIAKNKSGDNSGFFAGYLFDATVSNVNIDCTRSGRWAQMPLANRIINSSLSNIVVTVNGNTSGGGDGIVSYLKNTNAENTNVFTDCYVVSDKTIANSNANNRYDAKYVNGVAVEGGLDGIKRYTTADEFLADKDNNDYSSFNADVWDTSSGMPLWKKSST